MQWVTILLIGIAANIDNLAISVSYGLKLKRIPILYNFIISLISIVFAFVSISAGSFLSHYFSQSMANFTGGFLITALGIWFIMPSPVCVKNKSMQKEDVRPAILSVEKEQIITLKESSFLGFLLALNCLAIGFGAGITGFSPFFTSISIGVFSLISISLGIKIGNKIGSTLFGKYSTIIAGLLLIIIGIYEMFF
ncbi:manganese efflux pump [Sporosarcina sp. E16_3]|uniref:manganese efflux pump MntP n=1 Tax=Sporosarcina sp. E16_3 TaxID=2789293 RepID=UPI001A92737D|nr:manganese efflux pump [Sporosarcina sp. E16_3]MBO0601843.1 manganese efflux pump [Sporosarcina sp. E16_3]